MIEKIVNKDEILAIIIRSSYESKGIEFFTPKNFSQQLGYMNRPRGYEIEPHFHKIVNRTVEYTNEVLFVKSGEVKVDFYDEKQIFFTSRVLNKGDIILLVKGGHGFKMLQNSEMIEVKQGPYISDNDKIRFQKNNK
jgi:mannose-6-phosphate isomerase-like protein (cupin superfamily)